MHEAKPNTKPHSRQPSRNPFSNDAPFFSPAVQKKDDQEGGQSETVQTKGFFSNDNPFFPPAQAKLKIGQPGDKYEQEADSVAEEVVSKGRKSAGSEQAEPSVQRASENDEQNVQTKVIGDSITPLVQREMQTVDEVQKKEGEEEAVQAKEEEGEALQAKEEEEESLQAKEEENSPLSSEDSAPAVQTCAECDEVQAKEEEEGIQAKEEEGEGSLQMSGGTDDSGSSNLESQLSSSKGGGSPMDESTRSNMESGFGKDFSGVNIHTGSQATQMNQSLGSQAFTHGNDIYFNEGKYNPGTDDGDRLLAHELTHTVQQGASTQPSVQQKKDPEPEIGKPSSPLDITHRFELTREWADFLDAKYKKGERSFEVDVKIGERYSGTIKVRKLKSNETGQSAKYDLVTSGTQKYLNIIGWSFLDPIKDKVTPILVLKPFGEEQTTSGFLSVKLGEKALTSDVMGFIKGINDNLEQMRFLGIKPLKTEGVENTFESGRLVFQVGAMSTVVDGFLEAGGGMGITGDSFTFNLSTKISVGGLAEGEFMIARGEDGALSGSGDIEATIANVQAKIHAEYIDGIVTIQGTGRIESDKFSGEITLLVTDAAKSKQMMHAALGVETMEAEQETAETTPKPKSKDNQVLAGWGEVKAAITPWLEGTAKIGINAEGHVTIVGEIAVPNQIELMEQRGKKVDIFKLEIRAGYGIPLVGQVFLFASIGMFMNAGFGPLVLKDVAFNGTYSTDPSVLQEFSITGTLGINAFAILGLEAEAGVGLTLLGHDVKAGVNVTAAAGLRAYAEATPTLIYSEQASPEGGKVGETHLKGHFEAAAQLFAQLSGAFFVEIDAPWWSPVSDGREEYPLGEVQYPIGDTMGIGADMDWLVGSPDIPEVKFSPVEFDADKFTSDIMADPPPRKYGKSDADEKGEWVDGNAPGDQKDNPELKDGEGLPENDKKKEDLKNLPDEEKYMRALDEMSKLEKASPKATLSVVNAKAAKVKAKYGLDKITVKDKDNEAEIFVKHKKEDNGKHLLMVPLMSEAERLKLLSVAMDDLTKQSDAAADKDGTIEESKAKELLATWKKANPIIEEAHVKDGEQTWDYFIDLGDKSDTVKGKKKKVAVEEGGVPAAEGDGEIGKVVKFSDGDDKHTLWIEIIGGVGILKVASTPEAVESKLSNWEAELKTDLWKDGRKKDKKKDIEDLLTIARAKLVDIEKNLSGAAATISPEVDDAVEAKEDSMAEVLKKLFQKFNEKYDFKILYAEDLMKVHPKAKDTVDKSVDVLTDTFNDKKEVQSWNTLLDWIKITEETDKIFENPIDNGLPYGTFVLQLIKKVGDEAFKDKEGSEREKLVQDNTEALSKDVHSHAFRSLQNLIFNKSLESEAEEKIKSNFLGSDSVPEHEMYKVLATHVSFEGTEDGMLVVSYSYDVQKGDQPKEIRKFNVIMAARDTERGTVIDHGIEGMNLAVKEPGTRGKTDSASNDKSRSALQGANGENKEKVKNNSQEENSQGELNTILNHKDYKDQIDDKTIKFNAAHLLADWFMGSGYKSALNLQTTSEYYNKKVMFKAESNIQSALNIRESIELSKNSNLKYMTFDLQVVAEWREIVDDSISKALNTLTVSVAGETDEEKKNRLASLHEELSKKKNPVFMDNVNYLVTKLYFKDVNGNIVSVDSNPKITENIGQDTHLKSVIK